METMRKLMMIMVLVLFSLNATAGDAGNSTLNERYYQAKVRELVYRLEITHKQQKKFEPIYREYCEEMTALWASRTQPIPPTTSSKAAAVEKRRMEIQQRAQGIRMKYIDKFATVLNAEQVKHFFEVESEIQKKIKERREQANRH
jgi:Spy/CpxP family protein refolding chaperone